MPFVYDPQKRKYVYTGTSARTGTSVAAGRLNAPATPLPSTPANDTGNKKVGGLLGKLVNPLVDLPDQSNPVLKFLETGVEQASSPVGLLSAALLPATGGASLGLSGALGVGARLGTRAITEVAVSAAASKAAEEVSDRTKDLPGVVGLAASIGAGALTGAVAAGSINKTLGVQSKSVARLTALKQADAGVSLKEIKSPVDKLSYLLRNNELVTGSPAAAIADATRESEKRFGEILAAGKFSDEAYKAARASLSRPLKDTRFKPAGITQPAMLRSATAQLTGTDIRDMLRTIKRNIPDTFEQYRAAAVLEDVTARGIKPSGVEASLLGKAFGDDFLISLNALETKGQAFRQHFFDLLNMPRSIQASMDLSAPLRQGIMLAPRHPIAFAKSLKPMLRAFADENYAKGLLDDLTRDADYDLMVRSGVEFGGFGGYSLLRAEEQFGNRLFDTTLRNSGLGAGVRASERAYTTFLNTLRKDVFKSVNKNWVGTAKATEANYKALSTMINNMTGRAKLPGQSIGDGKLLNAAFFAPRFVYSRFAAPIQLATAPPEVRKQIAQELGAFVGTGLMVTYLAKLAGAEIDINPTSSEFGKVKVGNTRYDFWGGYSQIAKAIAQTVAGSYRATSGQDYDANRAETVGKFLQSKLAPIPGLSVDLLRGETFTGQEITATQDSAADQLANRLSPLFLQDVLAAMDADGLGGALKTIPAGFGLGAATYTSLRNEQNRIGQELFGADYRDLTAAKQDIVNSDPRVVEQATRQEGRKNSYGDTIVSLNEERVQKERILAAALANGDLNPKDFADAISQVQRDIRIAKDQAARDFGVKFPPPDSPLQVALDSYYRLYDQADIGWNDENPAASIQTGAINWSKFDELEHQFFQTLTPEQAEYVNGRRTAEHPDPTVEVFYQNKKYISDSGYYDTIDKAFDRRRSAVKRLVPTATSYGDLLQAADAARATGDLVTWKRLNKEANKISSLASKEKEKLRTKNAELEMALFDTGRISTFLNPKLKRLLTSR